jgi:hypothetical protein
MTPGHGIEHIFRVSQKPFNHRGNKNTCFYQIQIFIQDAYFLQNKNLHAKSNFFFLKFKSSYQIKKKLLTNFKSSYQIQNDDRRAVLLHEAVQVLSGRPAKRVAQLEEDLRLRHHRAHVLSPVARNGSSNLFLFPTKNYQKRFSADIFLTKPFVPLTIAGICSVVERSL